MAGPGTLLRRTRWAATLSAAVMTGTLLAAGLAAGSPHTTPDGPWVQDEQNLSLRGFSSYEELTRDLEAVARSSQGRVTLETVGQSNEGRDLRLAKVGTGDRKILYITQQHGNEPHGTESAVQALKALASRQDKTSALIREELTVLMLVRVNPDGSERYWRQNVDPDCDDDVASCLPGRGWDPNRWHDPRIDDAEVPVPETVAVRETVRRYQPELIVDYHGQLTYAGDDGSMITTSVLWPQFPADVELTPERRAAINTSKQVSRLVYDLLDYGPGSVSQFPSGTTMGTARNAYGYLGAGSVLLEQRANAGQKSVGMLVRQGTDTMLEIAAAVADDSLADIDPAAAEAIPSRGPRVLNPRSGSTLDECRQSSGGHTSGEVRDASGELYDAVVGYASDRILNSGSNGYVVPTEEEACAMSTAYAALVDGDPGLAAGLAAPYDYEVVRLQDPDTGREHLLLAELPGGDVVQRGWGLYVHTPSATSGAAIQAPYPGSATFSERLAAQVYDEADASHLFVAGAHRAANDANAESTEPANVTHNSGSVFHRIHQVVVRDTDDVSVQVLGTSGGLRDVVVTSGETPPGPLTADLAERLAAAEYDVCLFGDGSCTRLGSTTNVQGQWSRSVDAPWAAVYPSFEIRRFESRRSEFAEAMAAAL